MTKEISKFNNELYEAYSIILRKVIESKLEEGLSMTAKEVESFVLEKLELVRKNGGIVFDPELFDTEFSRLSSVKYDRIMANIKLDLEVIINQIVTIVDLTAVAEDILNADYKDILRFANQEASKIRNLRSLFDAEKQYNGYMSDTLSSDTNTYDGVEYKALHSDGMYKLKPFVTDVVADNDNDAIIDVVIMNDNVSVMKKFGDVFSNSMLDGYTLSMFSTASATYSGTIMGEELDYEGLLLAYRIQMSDIKNVDNIKFNYFSTDNIDIVKVLYTTIDNLTIESQQWNEVADISSDAFHFGGREINFQTISAKEIVIIIGQKYVLQGEVNTDASELNKFIYDYKLSDVIGNNRAKLETFNSISQNSQLDVIKRDRTLYSLPSKAANLEDKLVKMFTEFVNNIYGSKKRFNDFSGYLYYMNIHNLRINNLLYKQFSVYESDSIISEGSIINARMSKNDEVPEGTWVNYYVMYKDSEIRVLKKGDVLKDLFTIDDPSIDEYSMDFLIDTSNSVTIKKNNEAFTNFEYIGVYGDIATGIRITETLRFGDIYVVEYNVPETDQFGVIYKPWDLDFIKIEGYPDVKHSDLINVPRTSRVMVHTSGNLGKHTCCYPISTRLLFDDTDTDMKYFYIHHDDIYTDQKNDIIAMQDPTDPEYNFYRYDLVDGKEPTGMFYKLPQRIDVSGVGGIESTEIVTDVRKDVYYGIIEETVYTSGMIVPAGSQPQEFSTEHEYIAGTLVCRADDSKTPITEYDSTIPGTNYDKDKFKMDTSNLTTDSILTASYVPIDIATNADAESNIMDYNEIERFDRTDANATVALTFKPYIDTAIIAKSVGLDRIWYYNENVYALKDNVSVTYIPIEVKVFGIKAEDITNYMDTEKPLFTGDNIFDETLKNYKYYVDGKTLFFNTNIEGHIEVKYYTMVDRVKLKAEMYRYNMRVYDITPELYDIMVLINTI